MYWPQTRNGRAVQGVDAAEAGRILVVDDDRSFGGFMMAALESRGHEAEWAGCLQDGLACLYSQRYDLVIIDLRLPDGSGIEFLRDATDEGLLVDSSAVILTGHDLEEPDDIRVFRKSLDVDTFLDRMTEIVAATKKRRSAPRQATSRQRSSSHDNSRPPKQIKIELVLYTSPASEKCQKAIRTLQAVFDQYNRSQIQFHVCDLSAQPTRAEDDAVVFTPTLVKRGPGPRTWIVGNLDQPDLLVDLLEVSGVERKRD